jgi:hypothetical protein
LTAPGRLERSSSVILTKIIPINDDEFKASDSDMQKFLSKSTNSKPFNHIEDIAVAYFRPRRAAELVYKNSWNKALQK